MSLYYEAADVLANADGTGGSLKSRLYKNKALKTSPAQLFALISEASKWSLVLKDVVERTGLLAAEKKLSPTLALLLTHDLLLAKGGVAAHSNHVLKLAVLRHKARLAAEFTKARIRRGFPTLEALRQAVDEGELDAADASADKTHRHPRWVRVNTLQTTLQEQLATTFAGYTHAGSLRELQRAPAAAKLYVQDPHIPDLLALPPKIDLVRSSAYANGAIILQDKASCFPAYLLDVRPEDGDAIDGCAAPGNKTTHLAAIVAQRKNDTKQQRVFAYERDPARAITLQNMVKRASADLVVTVKPGADFLAADPDAEEFAHVGAILLDPSCSGSGIVGRDDAVKMHLPNRAPGTSPAAASSKDRKRKRGDGALQANGDTTLSLGLDDTVSEETPLQGKFTERLTALSTFQLRILTHAMRFPLARKITYSTCSIHFEENEGVVIRALASDVAIERGWKILPREHQVQGMKDWNRRGIFEPEKIGSDINLDRLRGEEIGSACIRCEKGTDEGTMGFFVAAFVRCDQSMPASSSIDSSLGTSLEDDEWRGFSNDESVKSPQSTTGSKRPKKKRKRRAGTANG